MKILTGIGIIIINLILTFFAFLFILMTTGIVGKSQILDFSLVMGLVIGFDFMLKRMFGLSKAKNK